MIRSTCRLGGKHHMYLVKRDGPELLWRCRKCWTNGYRVERWAWNIMITFGRMPFAHENPRRKR